MNNEDKEKDAFSIPVPTEETAASAGDIKINNNVVANIVKLSALEVPGVVDIASVGSTETLLGFFSKNFDKGIKVREDEGGNYIIDVPVVLDFGVELAKTAIDIQQNVAKHVTQMTMKEVGKVNVIIDSVRSSKKPETL